MADFLLPFPLMALSILPGAESLSAFRAERLLARLRVHAPALRTLRCRDFYLVDADNTAESDLRRLLGPGPAAFDAAGLSLFVVPRVGTLRSEEHTSELQSLMRISYAVFCFKKKKP